MLKNLSDTIQNKRGFSFVDVVVGVGILALVFWGLVGVFRMSIVMITTSKAKAGAVALALDQMEYIRSLPYDSVGTEGGIPAGVVPPEESITLNSVDYTRRTFIQYVDAPQDGSGSEDENGITTDYKIAKVEVLWNIRDLPYTTSLVSNIVPSGIESTEGGGTLGITVINSLGETVEGARVTIENASVDPAVSLSTYSNIDGKVTLLGAPEGSGYEVTVTKDGYSTAGTYSTTAENSNPSPPHLSVIENTLTSATFAIDVLGTLSVRTVAPPEERMWDDTLDDMSALANVSSTTVSGGSLILTGGAGTYDGAGSARSIAILDNDLGAWQEAYWESSAPAGTAVRFHLYYDADGSPALVPDTVLSGNSTGFTSSPIDLSTMATSTYPELMLSAHLETGDPAVTPEVLSWGISYMTGPLPFPDAALDIRGVKTIGATSDGSPVYKFEESFTTDTTGRYTLSDHEWDVYTLTLAEGGYAVTSACAPLPARLEPGETEEVVLTLDSSTPPSLLIAVSDDMEAGIENASVRVYGGDTDITEVADECGSVFTSDIAEGSYTVEVSASGYSPATLENVGVSGDAYVQVTLSPTE